MNLTSGLMKILDLSFKKKPALAGFFWTLENNMTTTTCLKGGCHCGAVRYEVNTSLPLDAVECNCSICSMSGYLHLLVDADQFSLIQGKDDLVTYTFDSGEAKHHFCKHCGIKSFYVPRSNPQGFSINIHCLDDFPGLDMTQRKFDGQNWEASFKKTYLGSPLEKKWEN
jgi:hypothetical protein